MRPLPHFSSTSLPLSLTFSSFPLPLLHTVAAPTTTSDDGKPSHSRHWRRRRQHARPLTLPLSLSGGEEERQRRHGRRGKVPIAHGGGGTAPPLPPPYFAPLASSFPPKSRGGGSGGGCRRGWRRCGSPPLPLPLAFQIRQRGGVAAVARLEGGGGRVVLAGPPGGGSGSGSGGTHPWRGFPPSLSPS